MPLARPLAAWMLGVFPVVAHADVKVEQQVVAPAGRSLGYALSPRGMHVAACVEKGSRFVVVVDGVEGPKIDQLLSENGSPSVMSAPSGPAVTTIPVVFSEDGTHCAYVARVGAEYIVMFDGKEISRGAYGTGSMFSTQLALAPGGRHVAYALRLETGGVALVVDGKPELVCRDAPLPVFSPDGSRYAYLANTLSDSNKRTVVVDGKDAGYTGEDPRWTADGKYLLTVAHLGPEDRLLVEGQVGARAQHISGVHVPPAGKNIVLVMSREVPGAQPTTFVVVGGKKIEGSECAWVEKAFWNADGSHWAVLCNTTANTRFVVVDGKRGEEYQLITEFQFSRDGSKSFYLGRTSKTFPVQNGEEGDGYTWVSPPVLDEAGKHVGFVARDSTNQTFVVIDGQAVPCAGARDLAFSADGAHSAYLADSQGKCTLWFDGVAQPGIQVVAASMAEGKPAFLFSPDGKHVACSGFAPDKPADRGVALDGKMVWTRAGQVWKRPFFSPDGRHVAWIASDSQGLELEVDGQPTARWTNSPLDFQSGNWETGADGAITFLGVDGGAIKKFRVTPSEESGVDALLAAATK